MIKKILITGGAGYIGSQITELLSEKNFEVYVIDNLSRGFRKLVNKKAVFVKRDIRDIKLIKKFILKKKNKYCNTSCGSNRCAGVWKI